MGTIVCLVFLSAENRTQSLKNACKCSNTVIFPALEDFKEQSGTDKDCWWEKEPNP